MKELLGQLKRKWWDGDVYGGAGYMGFYKPRPRRIWEEHRDHIKKSMWPAAFAVLAAAAIKYLGLS